MRYPVQVNFEHGESYDFSSFDGYYDADYNNKVHTADKGGNCLYSILQLILYLNYYFDFDVCPSFCLSLFKKNFLMIARIKKC